jgi:phosphohistidine phosphatase
MDLLVIRHAVAGDRDTFAKTGKSDELRPITEEGTRKMLRSAQGLRRIVDHIDYLATSPLVRARQTAQIVADELGTKVDEKTDVLSPESKPAQFAQWLDAHRTHDIVAVVGHEPHLSTLVTWLVSGVDESRIELGKGGACLLTLEGRPRRGCARLRWLLTPRQLREIGS